MPFLSPWRKTIPPSMVFMSRVRSLWMRMPLAGDAVALERVGIDRGAEAGRIREAEHTTVELHRFGHHVTGHLQRPHRFASRQDRGAGRGHGGLGERR